MKKPVYKLDLTLEELRDLCYLVRAGLYHREPEIRALKGGKKWISRLKKVFVDLTEATYDAACREEGK